jgi:hypothetical protein
LALNRHFQGFLLLLNARKPWTNAARFCGPERPGAYKPPHKPLLCGFTAQCTGGAVLYKRLRAEAQGVFY